MVVALVVVVVSGTVVVVDVVVSGTVVVVEVVVVDVVVVVQLTVTFSIRVTVVGTAAIRSCTEFGLSPPDGWMRTRPAGTTTLPEIVTLAEPAGVPAGMRT